MADPTPPLHWRLRLMFWLMWFGYGPPRWFLLWHWRFANDETWHPYYAGGETPRQAIIEDMHNV